jgi:hypothetical protein
MKPQRGSKRSGAFLSRTGAVAGSGAGDHVGMTDGSTAFSMDELVEFLEADQVPVEADPAFRERLREELWEMLERARRARPWRD